MFRKYFDPVSIESRQKVFNIYKYDLEIFGYTWNISNNEIGGF